MTTTLPTLLPTASRGETFAGFTYSLDGELVPVLTISLDQTQSVYFEHHILLWKNPSVSIGIRPMQGALKRVFAGMQIFTTEARGPGQIAFSRDGAGHIACLHLKAGEELHVREHQFLAATSNVDYTFERIAGIKNVLMGASGFFIDKFKAAGGDGILWLHGYGNVFELTLGPGEVMDVEPSAWLYKDPSVKMDTNLQKLATGFLGGVTLAMNRFTGPGRLGIQSMSLFGMMSND